jgi:hypothetical protein
VSKSKKPKLNRYEKLLADPKERPAFLHEFLEATHGVPHLSKKVLVTRMHVTFPDGSRMEFFWSNPRKKAGAA